MRNSVDVGKLIFLRENNYSKSCRINLFVDMRLKVNL